MFGSKITYFLHTNSLYDEFALYNIWKNCKVFINVHLQNSKPLILQLVFLFQMSPGIQIMKGGPLNSYPELHVIRAV